MPRPSRGTTLLFWLMALSGGSALAACLILPPWLEYRALLELHSRARQQVAVLEARLTAFEKQIVHLRNDPAYVERVARREFGITTPGVETIPIERSAGPTTQPAAGQQHVPPRAAGEDDSPVELPALVAQAAKRRPVVAVFVLEQTRPIVMAASAVMLLAALVLLGNRGAPGATTPRDADSA